MNATGNRPPQRFRLQQDTAQSVPFDGTVIERHSTANEEYVHLLFGSKDYDPSQNKTVVDAEFLFLKGAWAIINLPQEPLCLYAAT